MKKTLRFLLAFLITFVLLMVVRALVVTIYTVDGPGLEPVFHAGDRVMVNRWSYGLRVGGKHSFFGYGRIAHQEVAKGDMVAVEHPKDGSILICRCKGLPGDTIILDGHTFVVPCIKECADADYYWMETVRPTSKSDAKTLGFIAEEYIIGRVFMVVYSREPQAPIWRGWRPNRTLMPL